MLHVLNSNERNHAFIRFVCFFLITTILIVCAIYVDFRGLPEERRKLLEKRLDIRRAEDLSQQKFVSQMETARKLLDSLDQGGTIQVQVDLALTSRLATMENLRQRDSTLHGKFNAEILNSFVELVRMKKDMEKLRVLATEATSFQLQLKECQRDLDRFRQLQANPQP